MSKLKIIITAGIFSLGTLFAPLAFADTGGHITAYSRTGNHITATLSGTLATYFCSVGSVNQNLKNFVVRYSYITGPSKGGELQLTTHLDDYAPAGNVQTIGLGCNGSAFNGVAVASTAGLLGAITDGDATYLPDTASGYLEGVNSGTLFVSTGANANFSKGDINTTIFPGFTTIVGNVIHPGIVNILVIMAALVGLGIVLWYFGRWVGKKK